MDLCELCNEVEVTIPMISKSRLLRSYDTDAHLRRSAQDGHGCRLCSLVLASHSESHMEWEKKSITRKEGKLDHGEVSLYQNADEDVEGDSHLFWRCNSTFNEGKGSVSSGQQLGALFAESEAAQKVCLGRKISEQIDLNLGRQWLRECRDLHADCVTSHVALPRRVIDVVYMDSDKSQNNAFLSEPEEGTIGQYLALSYCWGDNSAHGYALTTINLESQKQELQIDQLPKTIRDAIHVTRMMQIQYLWVDALCIIQDSIVDWQQQSARMCDIYNNATLTILALDAASSSEGFLHPRPQARLPPAKLKLVLRDGTMASIYVQETPRSHTTLSNPLQKRGWTLQEGLLASRVLSFSKQQLFWECKTAYKSEGGAQLVEHQGGKILPKPFRNRRKQFEFNLEPTNSALQNRMVWGLILEEYTSRKLTFAKDKLVALSGLAGFVHRSRPDDEYLAGLWKSEMPVSLLWSAQSSVRYSGPWRAPSWSWAAVDSHIAVLHGMSDTLSSMYTSLLSAKVTPLSSDPYGQLTDGILVLRGPLIKVYRIIDQATLDGDVNVQKLFENATFDITKSTYQQNCGLCGMDAIESKLQLLQALETWCLRFTDDEGLALEKVAGSDGCFRRIGTFAFEDHGLALLEKCTMETVKII